MQLGILVYPQVEELDVVGPWEMVTTWGAIAHWGSLDRLRALGDVTVVEDRFTRDGRIWCSAGFSAGIDLTLRYIAATAGETVAGQVQLATECFPSADFYGEANSNPGAPGYLRG